MNPGQTKSNTNNNWVLCVVRYLYPVFAQKTLDIIPLFGHSLKKTVKRGRKNLENLKLRSQKKGNSNYEYGLENVCLKIKLQKIK